MTSKLIVNNIEADAGVSTITFGSEISASKITTSSTSAFSSGLNVTGGSVGIGTDNPIRRLHVQSPGSTSNALFGNSANNNSIEVTRTGSTASYFQVQTYTNICNVVGGPTLSFRTSDPIGSASTERLRIDSSGNLGIGTNNPTLKTHILSDAAADAVLIESTQNYSTIRFKSATNSSGPTIGIDGAGGLQLDQKNTSSYISFAIGTERLRIHSNGRVSIGTPDGNDALCVQCASDEGLLLQSYNTTSGAADTGPYIYGNIHDGNTARAAGDISFLKENGTSGNYATYMKFRTRAHAGSPTERMRIDSSGRLLVNTTSDLSSNAVAVFAGKSNGSADGQIEIRRNGATPSANTTIGAIKFADGNASSGHYADIAVVADQDSGSGSDLPGRIKFSTTPDSSSTPVERMRITSAGFTKMFTTSVHSANSPYHEIGNKKNVSGDKNLVLLLGGSNTNNTSSYFLICGDDVDDRLYIYGNGNVVNSNNSYGAKSDVKLKENIVDAKSQWSDIKALQVRNYNFIEGSAHTQIGVVAQEVELVSPGLVTESPDTDDEGNDLGTTTKSVNYSVLYMKSVKALQEAMERIETLEAKVAALENP